MRLSYDLTLQQSQKLVMTPELRQAIELLQFNSLELKEYITNELEKNPMLEREVPSEEYESLDKTTEDKEIDWKEYLEKYNDNSYKSQVDKNIKEINYDAFVSYEPTLKEFLSSQLNLVHFGIEERKIAEYIVNCINDNGYLETSVEEIAKVVNSNVNDVELVLGLVQTFDPLGIGARDLKECLLIQVREKKDIKLYIKKIIEDHLEDLAHNRLQKISKKLDISIKEIQEASDYIKGLEPKPGRSFCGNNDSVKYIVPDAEIELIEDKFVVTVKDSSAPRLNINNYYRGLMRTGKDKNATEYLSQKFNSAMWIIKSIEQRRSTIKKVVESILKFQMDFFIEGEQYLKPLTLKEVAEDIDMHESTISRTTNGKYVQTPRGLFELKYFFSSSLLSSRGDVSSTSIKMVLKDIIDKEDPKKPYSDQKISEILKDQGISISRRTVAKYRDELNILSSSMRRRY